MNWDDLRFFLALYRAGSYKAAARAQRVDATTVGRRVAALELALAVKLFTRGPERALPTAAGRALLARAERIEAEVLASRREIESAEERVEGALRVTAGDGLVNYVLVPALPSLTRRYPELSLELRGETRALDLGRSEADVALRLFRPRERSLVVRRLGACTFNLFASRLYLERHGAPRTVDALGQHV
ncbi:MAG TPA: LysR substrate-binding domain-containing protein, partial [Polyangiaceae bacterium]|nr:LysR substrate-binding domain-containing protein [Polyangiaceae bacterium]